TLRLNNRKLLEGMATYFGAGDRFIEFVTILDKLDKIGYEGVMKELAGKGFEVSEDALSLLKSMSEVAQGDAMAEGWMKALDALGAKLGEVENPVAAKGVEEMRELLGYVGRLNLKTIRVEFDLFLARGLTYYTGTIFECVTDDFPGSVLGGGRYDNLTGVFGLPDVSGVGISFGADRIYDVMRDRGVFDQLKSNERRVLLINFGGKALARAVEVMLALQAEGIAAEVYPDSVRTKKQFKFADSGRFSHAIVIGDEELENDTCKLKYLRKREESTLSVGAAIAALKAF
ncbi:MAG: ATP phosphoribosyltransferase regulatory subunit, partial [Bacteroidota bacterium]